MSSHEHDYSEFAVNPITRVHKDYIGTAGDKAFLTKKCACGKVKPMDYGPTVEMRELLTTIKERYATGL